MQCPNCGKEVRQLDDLTVICLTCGGFQKDERGDWQPVERPTEQPGGSPVPADRPADQDRPDEPGRSGPEPIEPGDNETPAPLPPDHKGDLDSPAEQPGDSEEDVVIEVQGLGCKGCRHDRS
jgi:hypothetical protein